MSLENPALAHGNGGRLLVCSTPIGNLEDVTLRVLDALRTADVLACENTRHTQILLDRHGISSRRLVALHEHNERPQARSLAGRVDAGATVALVSDAGTPLISDPGFALVRACIEQGLAVHVLPGPSAALAGLVASGLPLERWRFVGFLPRRPGELRRLLEGAAETLVAFESPRRLAATLGAFAELDPERPVAVCRELTKIHEEVVRGSAETVAARYRRESPRGEIVLVLGAGSEQAARDRRAQEAGEALRELVDAGAKPRRAATVLAALTGVRANDLYGRLTSGEQ